MEEPVPNSEDAKSLDYFDQVAEQWDTMRETFFSEDVREAALQCAHVRAGELAADIGAGTGFITKGLLHRGLQVIAVDQSENMLGQMRDKFGAAVQYRRGDAEALPLSDGEVDHIFANMYLHHVESPPAAIQEMARTIRPGGRVVITDLDQHNFEFLRAEHHDRWMGFDRGAMQEWLEAAGLSDVQVESAGSSCCAESTCGCGSASVGIFIASGIKRA